MSEIRKETKVEIISTLRRIYTANRRGICSPEVDQEIEGICNIKEIKFDLVQMDEFVFDLHIQHDKI